MKKINTIGKKIYIICISLTIITLSIITNTKENQKVINTTSNLGNEKIGWGIKRNDNHMQPELGSKNKLLVDKYNGIAMGNNEDKVIYLTFDLGYEAGYTANILNVLKEKNVTATFFITAHYLNTASDLVKRMIDEGHIVGNQLPPS